MIRLAGIWLLALGAVSIYTAVWGVLWQPPLVEYLGWLQLYVLRYGALAVGVASFVMGLWYLWLGHTIWAARLWARYDDWKYARDVKRWRAEQAKYPLFQLTPEERLMYGVSDEPLSQEENDRLIYGSGARDLPEGWEACLACGQPINLHNPGEYDDECRLCDEAGLRPQLTLVQSDPLRHVAPDDGCFTQGSDPVQRREE